MFAKKKLVESIFCIIFLISIFECRTDSIQNRTEIFEALDRNFISIATKIIEKSNFDPNVVNQKGEALIFYLINKGWTSLANSVVDKPTFNPHVKNEHNQILLGFLLDKGWSNLAEKILMHPNFDKNNPDQVINPYNHSEIIKRIIAEELTTAQKRIQERIELLK